MRDLVLERDRRQVVADALGLSFVRVKALLLIARGEVAHHELASNLAVDKPHTTVILRDLLGRGLVATRPHPRDGRSKLVSITPAGAELADRATAILTQPPPPLQALSRADLAELNRILGVLGAG
jgi:DNA-binding MarR family transcriptional regulator